MITQLCRLDKLLNHNANSSVSKASADKMDHQPLTVCVSPTRDNQTDSQAKIADAGVSLVNTLHTGNGMSFCIHCFCQGRVGVSCFHSLLYCVCCFECYFDVCVF
jgi:hypothetical protein